MINLPGLTGYIRAFALAAPLLALPGGARAEAIEPPILPDQPMLSDRVAMVEWGIFCALKAMDRAPAPDTLAGWLHVPRNRITFHWPNENVVPASIGLAFGIRVIAASGQITPSAEARLYRPGLAKPDTWITSISSSGEVNSFFRFDEDSELLPGIWAFEAWDQGEMLYRIEFEVVPADARPEIANACGATS